VAGFTSEGFRHMGLFSKGPSNQSHDNHNHRAAKNESTAKVKFENDTSLLHEAEIAEKEGRLKDAQLIRRKIGD
jgi:hypothetical protein